MTLPFQLVGVFGDAPFEGNPAAVFLDAQQIPEDAIRMLANSIGGTAVAFVLPPSQAGAVARVRTVLAGAELEPAYLAHTVLGALHALVETRRLAPDVGRSLAVEVTGTVVTARLERRTDETTSWALGLDAAASQKLVPDIKALMKATALVHDDFELVLPIERSHTFLLIPVPKRESLRRITPDGRALVAYAQARDVQWLAFFCVESRSPLRIAARVLAPTSAMSEDAVTGTLHAALAPYLVANRVIEDADGSVSYEVVQGDRFGRIGRLEVRLQKSGKTVSNIEIAGACRTWIDGTHGAR
ncbi:MAG: PhzF family phenazine biosynthesis isomerase [Planctomycetes bacterium]|nr:PhzF family phenazine biosynthesis isomerase [Planctomycetota bacterium]